MSAKPAARIGDYHVCPKVEPGPRPHIGGTIAPPGENNILIGYLPAATLGSPVVCFSPFPDRIKTGSKTVFINGKPAARLGDSTVHGGMIISGCQTVFIG